MRDIYHEKLSELDDHMAKLCGLAGAAMQRATCSLLDADLVAAEEVISDYRNIADMSEEAEFRAITLLALEQPVAGELRAIVSALRIASDVDRMGTLAAHVATIARRRHPDPALPAEVRDTFRQMGTVAEKLAAGAQDVLRTRDADKARHLRRDDDEMDELHRQLFTVLMDHDRWGHGVRAAVDVALLSRYYERFADHAVEIGRRVVFEATGTMPAEQAVGTY